MTRIMCMRGDLYALGGYSSHRLHVAGNIVAAPLPAPQLVGSKFWSSSPLFGVCACNSRTNFSRLLRSCSLKYNSAPAAFC